MNPKHFVGKCRSEHLFPGFVTESELTLLHAGQDNESQTRCSGKQYDFIQKAGRLKSQNNHLIRVWMPVSFIAQRWGGDEEVK